MMILFSTSKALPQIQEDFYVIIINIFNQKIAPSVLIDALFFELLLRKSSGSVCLEDSSE